MQKIKQMFRKDYAGEQITTSMTWENGKWNPAKEFIPNRIDNQQISKRAAIIGNGSSREKYELYLLKNHRGGLLGSGALQTYGCNALYRDYKPTFLVATGTEIAEEIANSTYTDEHIVYANAEIVARYPGKFYLIPQDLHYNAGAVAVYLACFDGHKKVYMIGFDGNAGTNHNNNIYAGTNAYDAKDQDYADTMWVKTLDAIMDTYPDTEFIRVMPNEMYYCPAAWSAKSNFRQIAWRNFALEVDL